MPERDTADAVPVAPPRVGEDALVAALLRGDEEAFVAVVEEHHDTMLRVARTFVRSADVAEEVVQETWLAILDGLPRFEGRSSLRTWMFRILANRARTRARREGRTVPFSAFGDDEHPGRDVPHFDTEGMWARPPRPWEALDRLEEAELRQRVEQVIEALPERPRAVITLRDVKGWSSHEVCNALGISETNQRVLLHRARTRVRDALHEFLAEPLP